jgi:hypothetical protein
MAAPVTRGLVITALLVLAGCRTQQSSAGSPAFPLGPGPETHFAAGGAVSTSPSLVVTGASVTLTWNVVAADGAPGTYRTTSADSGASFLKPQRVNLSAGTSNAGASPPPEVLAALAPSAAHVQVAMDENKMPVAVWDERVGATQQRVVLRRLMPVSAGVMQAMPPTVVGEGEFAAYPAVAALTGGAVVAWVSGSSQQSAIAVRRVGLGTMCLDVPGTGTAANTGATHE